MTINDMLGYGSIVARYDETYVTFNGSATFNVWHRVAIDDYENIDCFTCERAARMTAKEVADYALARLEGDYQ